TGALLINALSTWTLGYPEQAVKITEAMDAYARRRGHPFDLGIALTIGGDVFDHLREPDALLKRIEEADRVGRENSLPILTQFFAPLYPATALIRKGQAAEGVALAGGKALPADLFDQILGKTDGVPLFVEELTRSIPESADLRDTGDRWEYAGRAN